MNRQELAKRIFEVAHLTGEFKLRSGQVSNEYFDKYRFESRPELLKEIAEQLKELVPPGTEVLAGLEMGGIPIATALSLATGIPVTFVRKKAKDYGTCKFAEGLEIAGKKVLVVEDVITTGGQVAISTADLRTTGAQIDTVICVIDRGGGADTMAKAGLKMKALFTSEQLKASRT